MKVFFGYKNFKSEKIRTYIGCIGELLVDHSLFIHKGFQVRYITALKGLFWLIELFDVASENPKRHIVNLFKILDFCL